ncbi:hypothetical protein [uncultured Flavobacterium sp.]|uniref:hypothetical protein n=1 Tax=uncultured Flavobacterium sp. TaxID=165435 RepID=UPI0030EB6462|tara:strand:+ start:33041 stop:34363 length:1323 start_codon:yes stop_codon:yes gene_type:complete
MFQYKTDAQLEAMTAAERDTYAAEKRKHEAELAKQAIDEAVKGVKEELEKDFSQKLTTVSDENKTLKETVEAQGVKIVDLTKSTSSSAKQSLEDAFKEEYDKVVEKTNFTIPNEGFKIDTSKVSVSTDVMSVNTINSTDFPAAGSTGVIGSGVQTLMGKLLGFFGYRSPYSKVLDLVDAMPLDQATLIVINETVTGEAVITTECKLKPIVKAVYATQEKSADPVAAEWATTTKLRRFFASIVTQMLKKFTELVNDAIPNHVLTSVRSGSSAFTVDAALAINDNPNNYDAIGAVIATLETLGFIPNAIIMHPIAWRNMKQDKNSEGIYTLSNGQSVQLVSNGLDWGGTVIPYIKDPKMPVGEFIVGDLMQCVKVGVDSELLYFETDGRTDAVATNAASGLSRNIRTHVLEKFVAVIIPDATKAGIIKDTFANVKTLITATP